MTTHCNLLLFVTLCALSGSAQFCDDDFVGDDDLTQPLVQISRVPRVYIADKVFTAQECERLMELAKGHLIPAAVMGGDGKRKKKDTVTRKAKQAALPDVNAGNGIVKLFRQKMANLALMPEQNAEALSVAKYGPGDHYGLHFDSSLVVGRYATVMVYLNDVEEGGQTAFPWAQRTQESMHHPDVSGTGRDIDELRPYSAKGEAPPIASVCGEDSGSVLIKPKQGSVLVFFNHQPDLKRESYAAMHGGCPVTGDAEKWIATLWIDWFYLQNDLKTLLSAVNMNEWNMPLFDN